MKRFSLLLSLIAVCSVLADEGNFDLSQVQWAPTMEDVMNEPSIKMLVFFEENDMPEGKGIDRLRETRRLTDTVKIKKVMEKIEDANICENKDGCAQVFMGPTWMGIVNKDDQGYLINVGWNHAKERVEWWGRYSKKLYDIFIDYGIIQPPKKPIYVNDPNLVHLEPPQPNRLHEKPRVITVTRERDLENFYVRFNPKTTPIYVQVDPESPEIYVAVDFNLAHTNLNELLPGINKMKEVSEEIRAQNRWLAGALNVCLDQLEAERKHWSIKVSPSDYVSKGKPMDPNEMPYEKVQTKPFPETTDIAKLGTFINLQCSFGNSSIRSMREYIKLSEQRMSRIQNEPAANSAAGGGTGSAPEENKKPLPTAYLEELRQKAEGGDALAACDLGWCYFNGKDIPRDYNEASMWFRKAVKGIAAQREQNNLGWCYYRGKGIEPNYTEPEKWFRQEAEKGDAYAQYFLGWLYTYGSGDLKQDESEAVKWWQKSAEQGLAEAQYELGIAYFYGIGIEENHDEGIKWQRKAAEQGLALAQSQMELCLSNIDDPNHSERIGWLQKAAGQGYTIAQKSLGFYGERGWDIIEGYKWSLLAEKNGSKDSFAASLKYGNKIMGRKPMTDDQIDKAEELARNFKEVKSEVTARSVTTMYQAMTLWKEGTEAHNFFFPPFW